MQQIQSKEIEKQNYKLFMQKEKEAKTKKLRVTLLLEGEEQGVRERTIVGVYTVRDIVKKEYLKDLGDRIPYYGFNLNEKKTNSKQSEVGETQKKDEVEQIHKQIEEYCLNHKSRTNATICGIIEAYKRVIEYVGEHANKSFWFIEDKTCIIQYDRLDELLRLVDCGWYDRTEFSDALKLNGLIYAGKDGRNQTKKGTKWVLKIKIQERQTDDR